MKENLQRSCNFHLIFYGDEREELYYLLDEMNESFGINNFVLSLHNHSRDLHTHLLIKLYFPITIKVIQKYFIDEIVSPLIIEYVDDYESLRDWLRMVGVDSDC